MLQRHLADKNGTVETRGRAVMYLFHSSLMSLSIVYYYTIFFTPKIKREDKILYYLVIVRCTGKSSTAGFVHLFYSDG
jgi:hypothetical protein